MSRIGNRHLKIPPAIELQIGPTHVSVATAHHRIQIPYNRHLVRVQIADRILTTTARSSAKEARMQQGTVNALINNAFVGLTAGFSKTLKITGVGYKAAVSGADLTLTLGFSHPVRLQIPADVQLQLISPTELKLSSFNRELLGEFAANIRKWRKPEPYKGKGIAYADETILRKVGKTSEGSKGKK